MPGRPVCISIRCHYIVLLQGHSLFQSEFSTECNTVLTLSVYSILLFPHGHPVAAYFFFSVFPSLLSFQLSFSNTFYMAVPTQDLTDKH